MINKNRFEKIWKVEDRRFGFLKKPWTISENNLRNHSVDEDNIQQIKDNLVPSLLKDGMSQLPIANGKGEIFIGGRRSVGWEIAGKETLLVEIRDIPPDKQVEASISENATKLDPTVGELGRAYKRFRDMRKLSNVEVAKRFGVGHTTVNNKIKIFEVFGADNRCQNYVKVPMKSEYDLDMDYAKAVLLLPLNEKNRESMVYEIENKALSRKEVRDIIGKSKALENLLDCYYKNPEQDKKFHNKIMPMLYKKETDTMEVCYALNELSESSQKVVTKKVAHDLYSNQKEADTRYFSPRGGRCLGEKIVKYWIGTVDPIKAKEVDKDSKEKNKGE